MKIHPSDARDEAETALLSEASLAADWNHKEEDAAYDVAARQTRSFASEKLRLLLAWLLEFLPWLHQWQSAVDLAYGVSPAESIEALPDAECHEPGLTRVDLETTRMSESAAAEFYGLLRNPAVLKLPSGAADAAAVAQVCRRHPRWRLLGFPAESLPVHKKLWQEASKEGFVFRRLGDVRAALGLLSQGVTEFATANTKDIAGLGFRRVSDPLAC